MRSTAKVATISMRYAKQVLILTALMCLVLSAGTNVWGDQVVTIYFCGTGIKSDAYLAENTSWKADPELLSTMFRADDSVEIEQGPWVWIYGAWTPPKHTTTFTDPHYHHKYIANGVGTSPGTNLVDIIAQILGTADPNLGARTWHNVIVEAKEALSEVYAHHPGEEYVLNLVGYSRGCISAMMMARALTDEPGWDFVKKINILVYDPVPGGFDPIGAFGNNFHLSNRVNQYVALYAEHERTYQFEPVIPLRESDSTKMLMVRVPGSHETLVGNHQIDGHFITLFQYNAVGENTRDPNFHYVKDMSRVIAEQLLTSYEWGNVPLDVDTNIGSGGVDSRAEFETLLINMWAQDYSYIPKFAFAPVWGTYDGPYSVLGRDYMLRILVPWKTDYHGRLCFVAPYRHAFEYIWWLPPFFFPNAEQVYWLDQKVPRISPATWDILQSLRGVPPEDTTPPVPTVDPLPPITGECSVTITAPPTATDNVSGTVTGTTTDPLTYTQQGTYTITWTYTDGSKNTSAQTQIVVVDDSTPPTPDVEELPIIQGQCSAGIPSTPTATDNCSGQIIGTTGDPLSYSAQGTYTVTWTYDDGNGNTTAQTQTVIVKDTTPPVIKNIAASPNVLWPANHKMARVTVNASASDNCGGHPVCRITSVSSNEPVNGLGDGDTAPDWEIIGNLALKLRAERSGKGSGRIYTITVMCADAAGNSSSGNLSVNVPHDRNKK